MVKRSAFDGINETEINKLLNCFNSSIITYKKDTTILSNVANTTLVGVIISGEVQVVRYNYNGTRTILEKLDDGDIFGSFVFSNFEDLYVITTKESKVVMFSYDHLINRCHKNCPYHNRLIDNVIQIFTEKLKNNNERIEILSKKTIRDKLLAYFNLLSQKQITKNIIIPFTLTDLADFLSIDRSAMMRELKNLKDENLIDSKGRKIRLKY